MIDSHLTRRSFLRQTAVCVGAVLAYPAFVRSASPNSFLQVASCGVNGMGLTDLSEIGSHPKVKMVGFCDVDKNRFGEADKRFPNVRHFADYREMLATLGDGLDAVSVSTPDHMHATIAMAAMRKGKHVYCQKPLARTVWEIRQMESLAAKNNLITQMGNQIHSNVAYRLAVCVLQNKAIGKIKEVHSYIGVNGREHNHRTDRPPGMPVPPNLNWDLWIGCAPMRPYSDAYAPFKWRDWQDFGSGALGDFGCHILDPIFTALGLTAPVKVRGENDGTNNEVWPGPETVYYTFPGTPLTHADQISVVWGDGGLHPSLENTGLPPGFKIPKNSGGSLIIGEEGTMLLPHWAKPRLYPEAKFKDYEFPQEKSLSHWHVWVDAIFAGKKTSDGFHYSGPLAETIQVGNIAALFPGQELEWDAPSLKFTNKPEANAFVTRKYRAGWELAAA